MSALAGHIYIPTEFEESGSTYRTYYGAGDPNLKDPSFFVPMQRVNDRYIQIDLDPYIEWIYTSDNEWVELSLRYDDVAPDNSNIFQIIY